MGIDRREFLLAAGLAPALGLAASGKAYSSATEVGTSGAWIGVDLGRIGFNLDRIRERARGRRVMAVVKANGYGHGVVEVGRYLDSKRVDGLMVASFAEAIALRDAGVRAPILNFAPLPPGERHTLIERNLSQVVFTEEVRALSAEAEGLGRQARVHVVIDTGLGRLGVPYYRALPFIESVARLKGIKIEGVMTSFTEERDFDRVQLARFLEVTGEARKKGIDLGLRHAASSDALVSYGEEFLLDMVRPGILVYGQYPSDEAARERAIEVKPALSLKARVAYVKTLRPGDSVAYHRPFIAREETPVATLPLGYSDGYPPSLAGKGSILIRGRRHRLIGAVTANHAVARLEGSDVEIGDEAVLMGEQAGGILPAEEVATEAGVSVYWLIISLSPLLPRLYTGA